jgi:hypothetical protein
MQNAQSRHAVLSAHSQAISVHDVASLTLPLSGHWHVLQLSAAGMVEPGTQVSGSTPEVVVVSVDVVVSELESEVEPLEFVAVESVVDVVAVESVPLVAVFVPVPVAVVDAVDEVEADVVPSSSVSSLTQAMASERAGRSRKRSEIFD